jgi:uncharacterized membrane protein
MRFFTGVNKKVFYFWLGWTALSIVFSVVSYFFFSASLWKSLSGFLIIAALLTPPSLIVLKIIFRRLGIKRGQNTAFFLALAAVAFFSFYTAFSLHKQNNFFTGYDLSIFDQAVWHMSRFEVPASSIRDVPVIFGDHFDPVLVFLAPFYWISSDVGTLLLLQGIILLAPVGVIYLWGREWKIDRFQTAVLSLFYLTSVPVQALANFDFHEIVFAPLFLLGTFYFLVKRRWPYYFLGLFLLLFTKEDLALLVAAVGLFVILKEREYLKGAATFVLGAVALFIITGVVMPAMNYTSSYDYWSMFPGFENGVIGGIIHYLSDPGALFNLIFFTMPDKWWTIVFFMVSFLIPIISVPASILLAVPLVVERALSTYPYFGLMRVQYNLLFVPIGIIAAFYFLKKAEHSALVKRTQKVLDGLEVSFTNLVIAFPLILNLVFSYQFTYMFSPVENWQSLEEPGRKEALQELMEEIPDDAAVSASQIFLPHLSHRQQLYTLPRINNAEFVILHFCRTEVCNAWPFSSDMLGIFYLYFKTYPVFEAVKENAWGAVFKRVKPFDEEVRKSLASICSTFIKSSHLEPIHENYFLESCNR